MDTSLLLARGWAAVALWLRFLIAAFGAPSEIGARGFMARKVRLSMLVFLRTVEAMARRLLAARASQMDAGNAPPRRPGCGRASSGHGRGGFAHADSARWAVTYRMLTQARPRRRSPRPALPRLAFPPPALRATFPAREGGGKPGVVSSLAVAERLEALIRVAADPDRHARRMARAAGRGVRPAIPPPSAEALAAWEALAPEPPKGPPKRPPPLPPPPSPDSS